MRRKINRVGPATLMVSLPSKWVKQQNLKKGDEVEVLCQGDKLILTTETQKPPAERVEVDISDLPESGVWRFIHSLYKSGIVEILITFDPKKTSYNQLDLLRRVVLSCMNLEIIQQRENFCIIKEILSIKQEEFDNIFNRLFSSIILLGEDSLNAIQTRNQELKNNIQIYMNENINKLSYLLLRIIYQNPTKNPGLYAMIKSLEEIGDIFMHILKIKKPVTLSKKTFHNFEKVIELLKKSRSLISKQDRETFLEALDLRKQLKVRNEEKDEANSEIQSCLRAISGHSMEIISEKVTLDYNKVFSQGNAI